MTPTQAAQFLTAHDNYLLLTHVRPDGDTIGSAAGLCRAPRFVWTVRGEGEYAQAKGLGECAIFERGG